MWTDNGQNLSASDGSLAQYLKDISTHPILTPEEEADLARQIKRGNREALHKLVEGNLRFVVYVVSKYGNLRLSQIDLIQEGNIGLIKAAEKFDPSKRVKFITYAVWWIRRAIYVALARQVGVIQLPSKHSNVVFKINRKEEELSKLLERCPTRGELAEALELTPQDIEVYLMATRTPLFIDASISEVLDYSYFNDMKACFDIDEDLLAENLREEINSLMDVLSERKREVVSMRFGLNGYEPMTLNEIGKIMGLSKERVRQIEADAIRQLHDIAKVRRLEAFLS